MANLGKILESTPSRRTASCRAVLPFLVWGEERGRGIKAERKE